ncbi:MAG: macro domain-containing protein [Solirubrobacteraceae bacterium]
MKHSIGTLTVELVQGDITAQPGFDAIVNAANAQLLPGGGVAGAIHRAAGSGLAKECRPLAPLRPGECVLTGGHALPNQVIHCLGPVYGADEPAAELLASCYRRALELAEASGLRSVAFPAISTGVFGYPLEQAADVALRTIAELAPSLQRVRTVRFVLRGAPALDAHERVLQRLAGE